MALFDPADRAFVADPYPVYARMRAEAPLWRYEAGAMWVAPRHADVNAALRDRRLGRVFHAREPVDFYGPWNLVNEHAMLEMEPPDHTRLRGLVAREFTPRRVERLRERIRDIADLLLDPLAEAGQGDLVRDFADLLPVVVIAELLGIPEADRHLLRPWSNAIVSLYELDPPPDAPQRAVAAAGEFVAYLRALIAERRAAPGEDLLSALSVLSAGGDRLSEDELVATAVLLLNAGHEASVNVIGNGVVALLRHPDELARLRSTDGLIRSAVEELIRYDSPLSLFTRTVLEPAEIAGRVLEPGEVVGLLLGSANRDPAAFADPDRVDVGRAHNSHVGFGAGVHFSLGAPLARVELQVALEQLLARFSRVELTGEPVVRPTYQFRGFQRILLRLTPAQARGPAPPRG